MYLRTGGNGRAEAVAVVPQTTLPHHHPRPYPVRNMWISSSLFNPMLSLCAMAVMPM